MRLEKEITIKMDEKTSKAFKVFEVTPKEIMEILRQEEQGADLIEVLKKVLPKLTDAGFDELSGLPPSDQEKLFEGFKEVNHPFLKAAGSLMQRGQDLGLGQFIKSLIPQRLRDEFVSSLKQDMAALGNTAFPFSWPPSGKESASGQTTGTD